MIDEVPDASSPSGKDTAKRKDKVRNVWISFVGRIVAQVIGAIASVVLGIMVLQRYQSSPEIPASAEVSRDAVAVRTRTSANPASGSGPRSLRRPPLSGSRGCLSTSTGDRCSTVCDDPRFAPFAPTARR